MRLLSTSRSTTTTLGAAVGVAALAATLLASVAPAGAADYPPRPRLPRSTPAASPTPVAPSESPTTTPPSPSVTPSQGGGGGAGQTAPAKATRDATTPSQVAPGSATAITGTAAPGTRLLLLSHGAGGTFRIVGSAVAGPDGRYSFLVLPSANTRYRVDAVNDAGTTQGDDIPINVVPNVFLSASRAGARTIRFSGYVEPSVGGVPIAIFRNGASGGSVLVARTVTDATGGFSLTRRFVGRRGTFLFFARTTGNADTLAGTSKVLSLTT